VISGIATPPTVCVFCSSARDVAEDHHQLAREVGRGIARAGWTLLYGGTTTGTMASLADAARGSGGRVVGVCLRAFVDLGIHDTAADELVVADTLGERKDVMIRRAAAFLALPGGFGTLDEVLEVISQRQLGLHAKPLVVLDHAGLFTPLLAQFELLRRERFTYAATQGAYEVAERPDAAMTMLRHLLA
jgi:uncharacterized protein (TIGR00730 family)